jgi:hypothetical protein
LVSSCLPFLKEPIYCIRFSLLKYWAQFLYSW